MRSNHLKMEIRIPFRWIVCGNFAQNCRTIVYRKSFWTNNSWIAFKNDWEILIKSIFGKLEKFMNFFSSSSKQKIFHSPHGKRQIWLIFTFSFHSNWKFILKIWEYRKWAAKGPAVNFHFLARSKYEQASLPFFLNFWRKWPRAWKSRARRSLAIS